MLDGNTAALDQFERDTDRAEREYEHKLSVFRDDPYSWCEFNIDAFGKYDMLGIVLETLLFEVDPEAGTNYRANQCSRKDLMAAIEDSIQKVEL